MFNQGRHGSLRRKLTGAFACALIALTAIPAAAGARPPIETIVQDDAALMHQTDDQVRANMERLKSLGVDRVRLTAGWSVLAPNADSPTRPDFDASDPNAYPDTWGFWKALDRAVVMANEAGLQTMIDIAFWAPLWATQGDPNDGRAKWNINPAEFAEFTKAVVRRYNGDFVPQAPETETDDQAQAPEPEPEPSRDQDFLQQLFGPWFGQQQAPQQRSARERQAPRAAAPLPKVSWWTVWNEPNHPGFIQPQWERTSDGWRPKSPHIYRKLVEVAYPAIKGIQPDSLVLVGATSSTGATSPRSEQSGTAPLLFIRELACVDEDLEPISRGDCANYTPLQGDGFSHHPYSLMHRPDYRDPRHPDNLPIGALDRLTKTLDKLVKMRRISPRIRDVYLTEFGYETNPPDPDKPWTPAQQALYLNWSEYLAWSNKRVRSWPQFLLRDMGRVSAEATARGKREWGDWQSGLLFEDGTAKPSATSFKLALFAECQWSRKRVRAGGRTRSGRVRTKLRWKRGAVRIWGHVRPSANAATATVSATRNRGSAWSSAATSSSRRPAAVRSASAGAFQTNATGVFVRYAGYTRGTQYRVESSAAGAGASGLGVTPRNCSRPAKAQRARRR
ncbi:MAG: hypothetical protein WD844_10580 [Thermoleophilaceae bacterium]